MSDEAKNARIAALLDALGAGQVSNGHEKKMRLEMVAHVEAAEARIEAAEAERDEWKQAATHHHANPADYRYWEGRYRDEKARAEAAEARVSELEGVIRGLLKHEDDIKADVLTSHRNRGDGASDWMREDDRDFRRDMEQAFVVARAALNPEGDENG